MSSRRSIFAGALALGLVAAPGSASAREGKAGEVDGEADAGIVEEEVLGPPGMLRARADTVSFDPTSRSLELSGDVRVDGPPFHLRAQRIVLSRTKYGVEIDGKGKLAFCPCLGTPLTLAFDGAVVAPPGDLILKGPSLQIYGVPVAALPWFWLRSEEKLGVLPPDVAYRGRDGVFVGGGVHVPWRTGAGRSALDLRSGAYLVRGFVVDARLRTPSSTTKIRFDRLPDAPSPALPFTDAGGDDGLLVDARGASGGGQARVAWDADVLRGRRGVASTTDLDAAARPYDRTSAEAALRAGGFVVSAGALATSRRGGGFEDVDAAGPITRLRASGAAGSTLTWDATAEGGALRVANSAAPGPLVPDTVSFVRAEAGVRALTTIDAVELSVSARAAGDAARQGRGDGTDRAATTRARLAVPLARSFQDAPGERRSPLVHVLEPFVEGAVLHAKGDAFLGVTPGRGMGTLEGTAPILRGGLATSLGRWSSRESADVEISGGGAFASDAAPSGVRPLLRARGAASSRYVGMTLDAALVAGEAGASGARAGVARLRAGALDGLRVLANVAARAGGDPILARALTDAPLEPSAGFLQREGTTGGAALVVPWTAQVSTSGGADLDLGEGELVAARGSVELRDRCKCVTLRLGGASHRSTRRRRVARARLRDESLSRALRRARPSSI